ncbi:calpain catalytic domain-containing protein [Favolaschia claudopus]|uniref:Calpain catalytic domain-containing protein n=1 Tax=Favolaschia claudopus TaxID=2862362 RepID=A0AAW0DZU1_9AGAR
MPSSEDTESTYAKAVKAEFAKDYDAAFRLYIKAAESYLHLSRSADHDRDKTKYKTSAGKALERAEKIKAFVNKTKSPLNDPSAVQNRLTPVAVDHFSPQEQSYAVKKGALVNGRSFSLWNEKVTSNAAPGTLFEDPDGILDLSPQQSSISPTWNRPTLPENENLSSRLRPQDILQHSITDCSLCASISVCLEHSQRFGSEFGLLRAAPDPGASLVCPISKSDRAAGRYDLRLLFNGAWRRIVIDDKLPYHPTTGALVCMSSAPIQGKTTLWPSLLEKGYMKLMGGYDFPGSNSSIDLHALVGWIPEHLEIKSASFEREATWTRLVNAFRTGKCMLTVGTGINPHITWRGVKLLPSHSYAVIDVKEEDENNTYRGFTVLDSWEATSSDNADAEHVAGADPEQSSGMLEIPWTEVLDVFDSVYVSWDPRIWANTLSFHGTWKQTGSGDQRAVRHLRLTFTRTDDCPQQEMWILLTRHVADTRRTSDFISLRAELEEHLAGSTDISEPTKLATKGTYTNSTHVLVRAKLPISSSGTFSVFAAYDGQAAEVGFSLSVYAPGSVQIAWDERVVTPPFTSKVEGALTSKNGGGNSTHPTFMVNPQYHLRIHPPKHSTALATRKADVSFSLQTGREVPVNIALTWSQGGRVFELTEKDLAATSGAYSYGLARLNKYLQAGDYTVIVSAFEPNQFGAFTLEVQSSLPFDLKPIPQEGAGMYAKTVRGAWTTENAMGGPSFKNYAQNPVFELDVQAPSEVKIRLQLLRPKALAALNLTLFPAPEPSSGRALGRHISTSGAYDDSVAGVAIPQIALAVGRYWVVPSTYAPGVLHEFQIVVYSTSARVVIVERP